MTLNLNTNETQQNNDLPYAEFWNAEYHIRFTAMLNFVMVCVVMLNVVMLSVVAPSKQFTPKILSA